MSLLFATQLTTVATAVLALSAIVPAACAIRAFRKQPQEVSASEHRLTGASRSSRTRS